MDPMETGLRYRLRRASRQIAEQHKHMRVLVVEIEHALKEQLPEKLKDVLWRFHAAMEAHFALEDGVFFPALHGLHPEQRSELEELSRQHQKFGLELERLRQSIEEGSFESFRIAFYELVKGLAMHEQREEKMVRSLADIFAAPD